MNTDSTSIIIKIDDHWFDCSHYAKMHPGGKGILQRYHLKDATQAFNEVPGHVDALRKLDDLVVRDETKIALLNEKYS